MIRSAFTASNPKGTHSRPKLYFDQMDKHRSAVHSLLQIHLCSSLGQHTLNFIQKTVFRFQQLTGNTTSAIKKINQQLLFLGTFIHVRKTLMSVFCEL